MRSSPCFAAAQHVLLLLTASRALVIICNLSRCVINSRTLLTQKEGGVPKKKAEEEEEARCGFRGSSKSKRWNSGLFLVFFGGTPRLSAELGSRAEQAKNNSLTNVSKSSANTRNESASYHNNLQGAAHKSTREIIQRKPGEKRGARKVQRSLRLLRTHVQHV